MDIPILLLNVTSYPDISTNTSVYSVSASGTAQFYIFDANILLAINTSANEVEVCIQLVMPVVSTIDLMQIVVFISATTDGLAFLLQLSYAHAGNLTIANGNGNVTIANFLDNGNLDIEVYQYFIMLVFFFNFCRYVEFCNFPLLNGTIAQNISNYWLLNGSLSAMEGFHGTDVESVQLILTKQVSSIELNLLHLYINAFSLRP